MSIPNLGDRVRFVASHRNKGMIGKIVEIEKIDENIYDVEIVWENSSCGPNGYDNPDNWSWYRNSDNEPDVKHRNFDVINKNDWEDSLELE